MDTPRQLALAGAYLTAFMVSGCMSPYPYYQYPQSYPGGYYGQPQMLPPGSSTTPFPGNVELNAPTPADSPGTGSGSSNGSGSPNYDPSTDAPMFNDSGANKVPDYTAPGDLNPPPKNSGNPMFDNKDKTTFESGQNPFGASSQPTPVIDLAVNEVPMNEGSAKTEIVQVEAEAPTPATPMYDREKEVFSAEFEQPVDRSGTKTLELPFTEDSGPDPYAHDGTNYTYLRGIVTYDDLSKTWAIIYNDKPTREDEYGGVFTLTAAQGLSVLNENDVVHVEGRVSETERDDFGKPKYVVEHLTKLQPKK